MEKMLLNMIKNGKNNICMTILLIKGKHMKVSSIDIKGIAGIKSLELNFNDGINIICGTNGIGKTTILECIATTFLSGSISLKRNSQCSKGIVNTYVLCNSIKNNLSYETTNFEPITDNTHYNTSLLNMSKEVLYLKPHRNISYNSLQSINKDPIRTLHNQFYYSHNVIMGISGDDIKNWLINRYLFYDKAGSISTEQKYNYELSTKCFSILDENIKFKTVIGSTFEILLDTNKGDIYFEYLSAGYKSVIHILLGLIKEIEYRINNPFIKANDFEGIILIDEIDVHLHPHWQSKLVQALKEIFPKAQIIATTHSPTILQNFEENEIIALEEDPNNGVRVKELNLGDYGLKGWSVEEILTDVMGLTSTSSALYQETLQNFDSALNEEDSEKIMHYFNVLDKMLHPNNPLRKLFKIQVAEWEE